MGDRPWDPVHPVDQALARALVHAQFPELGGLEPERLGQGWDMDVWRFGELVFRFPRRPIAVGLVDVECRVLPWLAPRLPVAIPAPAHLGVPSERFPAPFYGHRLLAGTTAEQRALGDADRVRLAAPMGAWLRAQHGLPLDEARAAGVPEDTFRGDTARSAARSLGRLDHFRGTPWQEHLPAIEARLRAAPPPHPPARPVLLHGDLYARHLLLDPSHQLAGVIDWGDVSLGDPAVDLSLVWTFLPRAAHPAFFAAYGAVDDATLERARHFGLARYGVSLLLYALDVGDAPLRDEAAGALARTL